MMHRGEVGLIFAAIGSLGVMNDALFSAVVIMIIVTTMTSPPQFKYCLNMLPGVTAAQLGEEVTSATHRRAERTRG